MDHQFEHHYTLEEARALLPQLRQWLQGLQRFKQELDNQERRLSSRFAAGADSGGSLVNEWTRTMADMAETFQEFKRREIFIKDLERGLLDIPSLRHGREVFLCWELDEDDIQFWHDIETGYAGRERID
jgi:hypothetical protein